MANTFNLNTWDVEAERSEVHGRPQPHSNLGVRLGYTALVSKQDKIKRKHLMKEVRILELLIWR